MRYIEGHSLGGGAKVPFMCSCWHSSGVIKLGIACLWRVMQSLSVAERPGLYIWLGKLSLLYTHWLWLIWGEGEVEQRSFQKAWDDLYED